MPYFGRRRVAFSLKEGALTTVVVSPTTDSVFFNLYTPNEGCPALFISRNMEDTIYFREGPSDKVYQACIRPKDNGFMVHFAYGRRGSTLNTGCKTQAPVEYQIAKGIYDKLIKEKMSKGYLPGTDSPQKAPVEGPKKHSGIQCQLLNPIEAKQAENLLTNPDCWMQEKMDGRRLLIRKEGDTITGINRLGFITSVPPPGAE